jgi:hypothetical protein
MEGREFFMDSNRFFGKNSFLFFLAILAGFALLILVTKFITPYLFGFGLFGFLKPILFFIAVVAIIIFALVLIWKAFKALFHK